MPPTTGTPVELEGGERTLRYDKNAIYQLQQRGRSLPRILADLVGGNSNAVVDLVWAGLLHEKKAPSIAEAIDLVPLPPPDRLLLGVMKAVMPVYGAESNPDFAKAVEEMEAALNAEEAEPEPKKKTGKRPPKASGTS